jgi:hypothetical protein
VYSRGILISARILISAADFGGKKMHIGIKSSKNFFWIIKILYFVIMNQEKKLRIFISLYVFFNKQKKVQIFRRFLQSAGTAAAMVYKF